MGPGSSIHLAIIFVVMSQVTCWTSVRVSTCNPPVSGQNMSICCFLENQPSSASVFFSRQNSTASQATIVARIAAPCSSLKSPDVHSTHNFSGFCNRTGLVTNISLTLAGQQYGDHKGETWRCGFYGNSSSIVLNKILTSHVGYVFGRHGDNVTLSWNIQNMTKTVTLYSPTGDVVLAVSFPHVTYYWDQKKVHADVTAGTLNVRLIGIQPSENGTYVIQYPNVKTAITLVMSDKPRTPVIKRLDNWRHLSNNRFYGSAVCATASQSAAPLYYGPEMNYMWRKPNDADAAGFVTSNSSYNDGIIVTVDCNKITSLPLYCSVTELSMTSYSEPWDPHSVCTSSATTQNLDDKPAGWAIILTIVFLTLFVFTLVISIIVGRRRVKRAFRKSFKSCGKCCIACRDCISDSDNDDDTRSSRPLWPFDDPFRGSGRSDTSAPDLQDGLGGRDSSLQRIIQQIAIDESREAALLRGPLDQSPQQPPAAADGGVDNPAMTADDTGTTADDSHLGAVGGAASLPRQPTREEKVSCLKEVEVMLDQHNKHLRREAVVLEVHRDFILDGVLAFYSDENVAVSRIIVKMIDENGLDCGGVTSDMFSTFWSKARDAFFRGYDKVTPFLHAHRLEEERKFLTLGRILSHSVAVTKEIPIPMCKSAFIGMIFNTTDVATEVVLEDFLLFLDPVDRDVISKALQSYSDLTTEEVSSVSDVFMQFDYGVVLKEETFRKHLLQLARTEILIKPKPLLELMRQGLPESHFQHFWMRFHLESLDVLFMALDPTPERIVSRLKTVQDDSDLNRDQKRTFRFLKEFIKEMSDPELRTFLQFVTGKMSTPRDPIAIEFTHESGATRAPKAHTCSNLIELPDSYRSYDQFKSEFKHLLAADEAMIMTME